MKTMWFKKAKGQFWGKIQKMGRVPIFSVNGKKKKFEWEVLLEEYLT